MISLALISLESKQLVAITNLPFLSFSFSIINKRVEARFHKNRPDEVEIFFENCSYGKAVVLDPNVNAHIGRDYGDGGVKKEKPQDAETFVTNNITGQLFGGERRDHDHDL